MIAKGYLFVCYQIVSSCLSEVRTLNDIKARQVLSAFAVDTALVLAHIEIDEKSNEIPAVQKLLQELDVAGHIVTCDAMHCQKKLSRPPQPPTRI